MSTGIAGFAAHPKQAKSGSEACCYTLIFHWHGLVIHPEMQMLMLEEHPHRH